MGKALVGQTQRASQEVLLGLISFRLATQQPSREVIRGVLDSNTPARVALMMVKWEESKMLLGQTGAEKLLGKGDLLFRDVGEPVRLQAPLL